MLQTYTASVRAHETYSIEYVASRATHTHMKRACGRSQVVADTTQTHTKRHSAQFDVAVVRLIILMLDGCWMERTRHGRRRLKCQKCCVECARARAALLCVRILIRRNIYIYCSVCRTYSICRCHTISMAKYSFNNALPCDGHTKEVSTHTWLAANTSDATLASQPCV